MNGLAVWFWCMWAGILENLFEPVRNQDDVRRVDLGAAVARAMEETDVYVEGVKEGCRPGSVEVHVLMVRCEDNRCNVSETSGI